MAPDVLKTELEPADMGEAVARSNIMPFFPPKNPGAEKRQNPVSTCQNCLARKQAVCSALQDEKLEKFGKFGRSKLVLADETVFRAEDAANYVFIVISGEIRLSNLLDDGRRQITGFKGCGDLIGNQLDGAYTTDAEAVCDAVVCQFPVYALDSLTTESAAFQTALLTAARQEMEAMRHHAVLLGRKTPVEKICSFLNHRADKKAFTALGNKRIKLPMGRRDIADYLGLTIETVSRTLSKLKLQSVIEIPTAHDIVIKDMEELATLAEGRV